MSVFEALILMIVSSVLVLMLLLENWYSLYGFLKAYFALLEALIL